MKRTSQRLKASKAMTKGIKELGMAEDAAREQMPLRVISSGSDDYVSGPRFTDALPQGTNWVSYSHTDRPTSKPPKGTIKGDKLVKVSDAFASRFRGYSWSEPVSTISYTLRLSADGLVERVTTKGVLRHWKGSVLRVKTDTRYSAWGRQITIALPLKSEVLDQDQLEGKVPYQVPGVWS